MRKKAEKPMKFAYFPGCKIPFYMKGYGTSFEAIMQKLDVQLIKLSFNCCGYPARGEHFEVSVFSAIKNFAIAQKHGLDIITPCKCCFGQFKHAAFWYNQNLELKGKIDTLLDAQGLYWSGDTQIKHFISFLHDDFGVEKLKQMIIHKLEEKKIAIQYGCHALRPFSITHFDHPYAPTIFEKLVRVTGMKPVEWSKSTECCGNPALNGNKHLSLRILESKFKSAHQVGADYICTACTHCQMQYETAQYETTQDESTIKTYDLKPVLFTQILEAALGIKTKL